MIFIRARDIKEYIKILEEMVLSMNHDLYDILKYSDKYMTEESLMDSYAISAKSPTNFERVLINQGKTTLEECKENTYVKVRINELKKMLEVIK